MKERRRVKELEALEEDMNAEQLRQRLQSERRRMATLAAELAKQKMMMVHSELQAEMVEEGRVNTLIRRLEEVDSQKEHKIHELEQEEEMVGSTIEMCRARLF